MRCKNAARTSEGYLRCTTPSRVPNTACILRASFDPRLLIVGKSEGKVCEMWKCVTTVRAAGARDA